MHTPSLEIEEDMQFPKVLTVKQFSKKDLKTDHLAIFGPLLQLHHCIYSSRDIELPVI
jgi:hypothetical protein